MHVVSKEEVSSKLAALQVADSTGRRFAQDQAVEKLAKMAGVFVAQTQNKLGMEKLAQAMVFAGELSLEEYDMLKEAGFGTGLKAIGTGVKNLFSRAPAAMARGASRDVAATAAKAAKAAKTTAAPKPSVVGRIKKKVAPKPAAAASRGSRDVAVASKPVTGAEYNARSAAVRQRSAMAPQPAATPGGVGATPYIPPAPRPPAPSPGNVRQAPTAVATWGGNVKPAAPTRAAVSGNVKPAASTRAPVSGNVKPAPTQAAAVAGNVRAAPASPGNVRPASGSAAPATPGRVAPAASAPVTPGNVKPTASGPPPPGQPPWSQQMAEKAKPRPGTLKAKPMPEAAPAPAPAAPAAAAEKKGRGIVGRSLLRASPYMAAGGLGYGLYKGVPWAARQLEQTSTTPIAYNAGWSPVSYGYGYNQYGPGVATMGQGA